jgi:hypothetical protein
MWQGMKTITDYKGKPSSELPSDASLPDMLNAFYELFEESNTEACMRAPAVLDDCVRTLLVADVSKTFYQVNIHKAVGPDKLPGCALKACADQLASVFTDIFNLSLTESIIPTCFMQTTIDSVPKEAKETCLND